MADNPRWPIPNFQATADILDQMDTANHHIQISPRIPRYRAEECQFGLRLVLTYRVLNSPDRWLPNPQYPIQPNIRQKVLHRDVPDKLGHVHLWSPEITTAKFVRSFFGQPKFIVHSLGRYLLLHTPAFALYTIIHLPHVMFKSRPIKNHKLTRER